MDMPEEVLWMNGWGLILPLDAAPRVVYEQHHVNRITHVSPDR